MTRRLLSLNNYHYRRGGSDVVFLEHDALFRAIGWDTAVFAMHHPLNLPTEWSPYFVDEIEFGHSYGLFNKAKMAAKVIYSSEARHKLNKLLEKFPADIAHAHCIYHHLSPSVLSTLREHAIPVVMTAHDLKLACPAYKMYNSKGVCELCKHGNLFHVISQRCIHGSVGVSTLIALESAIHRFFGLYRKNLSRIVVPSHFFAQKLHEWGWPIEQITYIPNVIDALNYQPGTRPGNYFLYFGRLAPEKGLPTLIKAAHQARVPLKLAGTGPSEAQLKDLADQLRADTQFLGYQAGDNLWKTVREARAVVLPSEWYENAPMSVLESYACAKPVIGADIGGIPELITPLSTGLIFESGHVESLQHALRTIAEMPDDEVEAMGRTARSLVLDSFTHARYTKDMLELYSELSPKVCATADTLATHVEDKL